MPTSLRALTGALRSPLGATRAVAVFVGCAVMVWLLQAAFEPLRLNWGDPWSDANVLTTLEYSAKYGFWKTSFTDVLDIGPLTAESYRYTHYPPLAEIFYGLVRKVAGKADIGVYRVFAIAFSGAALYAVHAYVARVFGALAAACTVVFFATNALFLQYADSIHQAPVLGCTTFAALAFTARYADEGRRRDLAFTALFTFLSFLTAYDFYFFLPLAGIGTAWLSGKRLRDRVTLSIAVAIAVGGALAILLKSLFIIGALGWEEFKADFVFQFLERATAKYSTDYKLGLAQVVGARLVLYMTPLFFFVPLVQLVLGRRTRAGGPEERRTSVAAPLVLLAAGAPFLIVFSQLTATQVLPMQCLVPYFAVSFGVLTAKLIESPARWRRGAAIACGACLVTWQVVHLATFQKAFLRDADQKQVRAFLDEHDRNDFVLTNLLSDGPIQYYFQRHLHWIDPAWDASSYRTMITRLPSDRFHVLLFADPNTRYVDKSLFPLLAPGKQWGMIGAPPFQKAAAMDAIVRYDRGIRASIEVIGTRRLVAGDITVYSVGFEELTVLMRKSGFLMVPTERIDFGSDVSDNYKLYGIRGPEPGKHYSWAIPRRRLRSVLTKTGIVWRDGASLLETALLLYLPPGHDYKVTVRVMSHLPEQTLGAIVGERVLLEPERLGEPWKAREISFVVPKDARGPDPVVTVRLPFRAAAPSPEAITWDGDANVGVAFETLVVERLP